MSGNSTPAAAISDDAARIAALEQQVAEAQPILEAFQRLENLARERRTTPEAVAVQVTIDVLEEEAQELKEAVDHLEAEKARHQSDVDMLLTKREEISNEVQSLEAKLGENAAEAADLVEDIDAIRDDAVRLMAEKGELELQLESLRSEVEALERDRDTMRMSEAAISTRVPSGSVIDIDDEEEEAFDKFFFAETGKDKARAWLTK